MAFTQLKKALGFTTEQKAISLTDAEAFGLFGATPTAAGIQVSPNSALRVPAVACAVALIAETIGCLPAMAHSKDSGGGSGPVTINAPITVNGSAGTPTENADLSKRMAKEFEGVMRSTVADELRLQMRPGNLMNNKIRR